MEFNNMADFEKPNNRTMKDTALMKIYEEMMQLVNPATYTNNVWTSLE